MCSCTNRYACKYGFNHDPPWPELYSLMARGTQEFLSLFVEQLRDSSLLLNAPLSHQSLVEWLLYVVQDGQSLLQSPSLCHTRESSSVPTTDPALLTSRSKRPASPPFNTAPPTNHSIKENTRHNKLVKVSSGSKDDPALWGGCSLC